MSRNTKPEYSRSRVNKAGDSVRTNLVTLEDQLVIENWRAAHNKILNDWQAALRGRCSNYNGVVFAQRLKRRSTIFDKLSRQPDMQLSRMHDIAGCRLIFPNFKTLNIYRNSLHTSWMKHIRRKADEDPYPYDYITHPHPDNSGYRGIHDIYSYCARPGRDTSWNNLQVEIQFRTKAQHAWATANEIAGSITGNHSKFGRGDESQKEFFRIASEIIARCEEGRASVYADVRPKALVAMFQNIEKRLGLLKQLKNLKLASEKVNFYRQNTILVFDERKNHLVIHSFDSLPLAQARYFELEKQFGDTRDIVLVRAPTEQSLYVAYKNYFSDTRDFTNLIESGLKALS